MTATPGETIADLQRANSGDGATALTALGDHYDMLLRTALAEGGELNPLPPRRESMMPWQAFLRRQWIPAFAGMTR
ncbi:MAG TPA: hypothetical protein VH023_12720 [Rhodopila sp.]|jgi:hypothetical protein|nr:hypothetical protein [Rhodopila sp.]